MAEFLFNADELVILVHVVVAAQRTDLSHILLS